MGRRPAQRGVCTRYSTTPPPQAAQTPATAGVASLFLRACPPLRTSLRSNCDFAPLPTSLDLVLFRLCVTRVPSVKSALLLPNSPCVCHRSQGECCCFFVVWAFALQWLLGVMEAARWRSLCRSFLCLFFSCLFLRGLHSAPLIFLSIFVLFRLCVTSTRGECFAGQHVLPTPCLLEGGAGSQLERPLLTLASEHVKVEIALRVRRSGHA